ncbi:MAG: MBL fold metallo-hydrolase [Thauera sp.]|jgi:glyoxylase-like metal-dependent hydrolase (beta-lactamase superfamily II)|nr:MBL fold metallo-hydrolase [Thauera sp.]
MTAAVKLPSSMQLIERGWLSANNVLLFEGDEATLIDSGYVSHARQTVDLLAAALDGRQLTRLINTHSHSDHIGGNASVQRAFGCTITVPAGMQTMVAGWNEAALLLSTADQRGERFSVDATIAAGERFVAGELEWQAIEAPGHDMDALAYYNPERRILMSGDALWRDGFGILFADVLGTGDALGEARRTLEAIGRLAVDVVIPGHGAAFVEFDDALERGFARLQAFEQDGARMARNAIRACVTFKLLEIRQMKIDNLADYLQQVPLYRIANENFLGLAPQALADWLVSDLERAKVARRAGEFLQAS